MNKQELQQKIAEYYSKLPENLQQFFADMKWISTLQSINSKYNLTPEQIETLATETTLVLLCIINMSEYVKTIEDSIKLSTEQMNQLISEINDNIFKDIGYELEDTFIKNINDLTKENENKKNTTTNDLKIPLPPYKKETEIIKEEKNEIPLPNYNVTPVKKSENLVPKNEEQVYKETGIEIVEDRKVTNNEESVKNEKYSDTIKKEDHEIMKNSGIDIIGSKLFTPTMSTPTVSDHSLPKISPNKDPYKEEI